MGQYDGLTPEERARITEIQDLLIDRYVAQREALAKGDKVRARKIELDIKELQLEKEELCAACAFPARSSAGTPGPDRQHRWPALPGCRADSFFHEPPG